MNDENPVPAADAPMPFPPPAPPATPVADPAAVSAPRGQGVADLGKLLLRVGLGSLMLFHGIAKLRHGIDGIVGMVQANGLPTELAYGVYVGEVIAPLMLILGVLSRVAGFVMAATMGFAIYLAHAADVFTVGEHGGWSIELPVLYLVGGLSVALIGGGRMALLKKG